MTVVAACQVVSLEAGCCGELADDLLAKLDTPKYTRGVALMACPVSRSEWESEHRTARKRAWRAERLGYQFAEVDMSLYADDRYAINVSLERRQGRPMSEGYRVRRSVSPLPDYPCDRHAIRTYGVLRDGRLWAYMTLYRVGELGLISMILGHGDALADDVMYLLFAGMVEAQEGQGGFLYYNRWDSGQDGLRFYKERVGFSETDIEWSRQ